MWKFRWLVFVALLIMGTAVFAPPTVMQRFNDALFKLYDNADASKLLSFEAGNVTEERTLSARDASGTILISGDRLTGDVLATFDTDGTTNTILNGGQIEPYHLNANIPIDGYALTYNSTYSSFEWEEVVGAGGGVVDLTLDDQEKIRWLDVAGTSEAGYITSRNSNMVIATDGTLQHLVRGDVTFRGPTPFEIYAVPTAGLGTTAYPFDALYIGTPDDYSALSTIAGNSYLNSVGCDLGVLSAVGQNLLLGTSGAVSTWPSALSGTANEVLYDSDGAGALAWGKVSDEHLDTDSLASFGWRGTSCIWYGNGGNNLTALSFAGAKSPGVEGGVGHFLQYEDETQVSWEALTPDDMQYGSQGLMYYGNQIGAEAAYTGAVLANSSTKFLTNDGTTPSWYSWPATSILRSGAAGTYAASDYSGGGYLKSSGGGAGATLSWVNSTFVVDDGSGSANEIAYWIDGDQIAGVGTFTFDGTDTVLLNGTTFIGSSFLTVQNQGGELRIKDTDDAFAKLTFENSATDMYVGGNSGTNVTTVYGAGGALITSPITAGVYASADGSYASVGAHDVDLYFTDKEGSDKAATTWAALASPIVIQHDAGPIAIDPGATGGDDTVYIDGALVVTGTIGGGGGGDYVRVDGTTALTANWDVGNFDITMNDLTIDGTFTDGTASLVGGSLTGLTGLSHTGNFTLDNWAWNTATNTMQIQGAVVMNSSGNAWDFKTDSITTSGTITGGSFVDNNLVMGAVANTINAAAGNLILDSTAGDVELSADMDADNQDITDVDQLISREVTATSDLIFNLDLTGTDEADATIGDGTVDIEGNYDGWYIDHGDNLTWQGSVTTIYGNTVDHYPREDTTALTTLAGYRSDIQAIGLNPSYQQTTMTNWIGFDAYNYWLRANAGAVTNSIGLKATISGGTNGYGVWSTSSLATNNYSFYGNNGMMLNASTYTDVINGTNIDLYCDLNGLFGPNPSSRRFKDNIVDYNAPPNDPFWRLRPRRYDRIDGSTRGEVGLIAEEVADIDPNWVAYNVIRTYPVDPCAVAAVLLAGLDPNTQDVNDYSVPALSVTVDYNNPIGVNYSKITPKIVANMKRMRKRIKALEERVTALEGGGTRGPVANHVPEALIIGTGVAAAGAMLRRRRNV